MKIVQTYAIKLNPEEQQAFRTTINTLREVCAQMSCDKCPFGDEPEDTTCPLESLETVITTLGVE